MRRALFLLLALSVSFVAGCAEDDVQKPVPGVVTSEDFPLIDGLTYTYLTGSGDGPLVDTLRVVLTDDRRPPDVKPGRDFFGYRMYVIPAGSSEASVLYWGQISSRHPDTLTVNPNFSPNAGSRYVFPFEVGDTWSGDGTIRVLAMETVVLPAGRFENAYRICFTEWEETESGCSWTHWFVPGVGIVKVDYDLPDYVLNAPEDNLRVWELLEVSPELNP